MFYDKEENEKSGKNQGYAIDDDEIDPLDAFMDENNQETLKDIQTTYQKASMLTVVSHHSEKATARF